MFIDLARADRASLQVRPSSHRAVKLAAVQESGVVSQSRCGESYLRGRATPGIGQAGVGWWRSLLGGLEIYLGEKLNGYMSITLTYFRSGGTDLHEIHPPDPDAWR